MKCLEENHLNAHCVQVAGQYEFYTKTAKNNNIVCLNLCSLTLEHYPTSGLTITSLLHKATGWATYFLSTVEEETSHMQLI